MSFKEYLKENIDKTDNVEKIKVILKWIGNIENEEQDTLSSGSIRTFMDIRKSLNLILQDIRSTTKCYCGADAEYCRNCADLGHGEGAS
jgi:hypothetical protein